jgi:imidazole glycerol-phosphate synthase subunit HisH
MVAILNYNIGNITSILNMLKRIGIESLITNDIKEIRNASHVILPGIGSFDHCMKELKKAPFYSYLNDLVFEDQKWVLGVCVGHQMLFDSSEEGVEAGLGWVSGKVVKFKFSDGSIRVPHMGWNHVNPKDNSLLFQGVENPRFYFTHSYYTIPSDDSYIQAQTNYGFNFTSSVRLNNIFGVQFHPEKSHKFGMQLYKNFVQL